ncbi:MAG: PilT/PilU family type 4a pilus ATPase [Patescibacteria group bacterium]
MQASQAINIKNILTEAVKRSATDLHFSVGNAPILRINGQLVLMEENELITSEFMAEFISLLLDRAQQDELAKKKELMLAHDFDKNLRFKVNIFYQKGLLSATMRYISAQTPTIESLGLGQEIVNLCKLKKGLILIAGSFGSGRSSTIAAIIENINQTRKEYIITLESPIEYIFTNKKSIIEQREIGRDATSFKDALNYFQEEDGDVLFLEELRDTEIIPLVLEIARGSVLVISSMGADSATQAVTRILDSFQSFDQERIRDLLSTSLKAVICQKLAPKRGGGLMAVQEVMITTDAVKSVIANGSLGQLENIIQTSRREGMISFDQKLAELVKNGKVSREDALENASDKNKLEGLLK